MVRESGIEKYALKMANRKVRGDHRDFEFFSFQFYFSIALSIVPGFRSFTVAALMSKSAALTKASAALFRFVVGVR